MRAAFLHQTLNSARFGDYLLFVVRRQRFILDLFPKGLELVFGLDIAEQAQAQFPVIILQFAGDAGPRFQPDPIGLLSDS